MEPARKNAPPEALGMYGASKRFTPLRDDLLNSPAFLSLRPIAALVLIDFMRLYNKRSNFDRDVRAYVDPIIYTYGMCNLLLSRNAFYASIRQLQHHAFIMAYWKVKRERGKAQRWVPCARWKTWTPDDPQLRLLNDYNDRRAQSIENPDQMPLQFVANLQALNSAKDHTEGEPESISQILRSPKGQQDLARHYRDPGDTRS